MTRGLYGCVQAAVAIFLLTGGSAQGATNEAFLDFNHDGDLWTIDPIATQSEDTVTVIIQIGDSGMTAGNGVDFAFHTAVCDTFYGGYTHEYCGVDIYEPSVIGADWCNWQILDYCEFMQGVGMGCEPPWLAFTVRSGVVLEPGQRYVLCRLLAGPSWRPCDRWAEAYFAFWPGNAGLTNRIWLEPALASVSEGPVISDSVAVTTTWARIKHQFR